MKELLKRLPNWLIGMSLLGLFVLMIGSYLKGEPFQLAGFGFGFGDKIDNNGSNQTIPLPSRPDRLSMWAYVQKSELEKGKCVQRASSALRTVSGGMNPQVGNTAVDILLDDSILQIRCERGAFGIIARAENSEVAKGYRAQLITTMQ